MRHATNLLSVGGLEAETLVHAVARMCLEPVVVLKARIEARVQGDLSVLSWKCKTTSDTVVDGDRVTT